MSMSMYAGGRASRSNVARHCYDIPQYSWLNKISVKRIIFTSLDLSLSCCVHFSPRCPMHLIE